MKINTKDNSAEFGTKIVVCKVEFVGLYPKVFWALLLPDDDNRI